MLYLLDSTVLIDYLRGRPVVERVDRLEHSGDRLITTPVNVEEVVRGLRPSEEHHARALFAGLRVASIRREEGWQAGKWRREHAAQGITLSQADCLVAAVALTHGATLATGNPRDFPMEGVAVAHWPVGT